jgi:hypothetical protein
MPQDLFFQLLEKYDTFKESSLQKRRFKHCDILPLIENSKLEKQEIGKSFEGRSIFKIKLGQGSTKILLWSQMHGDEATATMAMFDLFKFFEASNDGFDELRLALESKLEIHFVPMLNPDGAERFQRRTGNDIDMNRDAVALMSPESHILKNLQDEIKPAFSFNLHDQNTRYSAGKNGSLASISFLATAFDENRNWNDTRTKSMQVIVAMNTLLQKLIPDQVGRFSDEFEPRAFGDNIQKWGSSLILVESGGYKNDREKQYLRKLNFISILYGLNCIASNTYKNGLLAEYEAIPFNERNHFDVLIKNLSQKIDGKTIKYDIGIDIVEKNTADANDYYLSSNIEDLGDLSVFYGIETIDASGMFLESFDNFEELKEKYKPKDLSFGFDKPANFVLTKDKKPCLLIVNGEAIYLN